MERFGGGTHSSLLPHVQPFSQQPPQKPLAQYFEKGSLYMDSPLLSGPQKKKPLGHLGISVIIGAGGGFSSDTGRLDVLVGGLA